MNKRILLVDDERNLNQLIATNLKFEGYETESAYSGIEAIDKLGRFSPDLVVLDVMMPGMDGFEVLETSAACLFDTRHSADGQKSCG